MSCKCEPEERIRETVLTTLGIPGYRFRSPVPLTVTIASSGYRRFSVRVADIPSMGWTEETFEGAVNGIRLRIQGAYRDHVQGYAGSDVDAFIREWVVKI